METGLWGSIMIFSGMVGALLAGFLLDYTKLFKEVAVVSYAMATICIVWFYEVRIATNSQSCRQWRSRCYWRVSKTLLV